MLRVDSATVASAATSVAASTKAATTTVEASTVARTTVEASGCAAMESTAARIQAIGLSKLFDNGWARLPPGTCRKDQHSSLVSKARCGVG